MSEITENVPVKHCVLIKIKPETSEETKSAIFELLDRLPKGELGIVEMVHGTLASSPSGPDLSRYDAFSTLQPANISPFVDKTAAPTANLLYGQ